MFVVEVGSKADMERILVGTPWMVGRHAVVLKPYEERLSADEIVFDRMEIWVHQQRGARAMSLIGHVVKMDVDGDGKASGAFLRARVAIELDKPLRRGVLLRMSKTEELKWFEAQYERLPFYCFSCGLLGHSEIGCPHSAPRNEFGKLPYDVPLRASEERRRRVQSFAGAVAESFGSGSSTYRPSKDQCRSSDDRSSLGDESRFSTSEPKEKLDEREVQSPLKMRNAGGTAGKGQSVLEETNTKLPRKRKSKGTGQNLQTLDLNALAEASNAIVPVGLVNSRVSQQDGGSENSGVSMVEKLKKQKIGTTSQNARSAAAASGSPRRAQ
jgi:hypothetical protein